MIYSKYLRNKLIDAAFRGGTVTFPATYYVALLVGEPTSADVYNEIGNVNARNYARVAVASNATNWAATNGVGTTTNPSTGTSGQTSNNIAIVFNSPTGSMAWATGAGSSSEITHVGLFDSATIGAGNLWLYAPITPKTVEAYHTTPTIKAGQLVFTIDR